MLSVALGHRQTKSSTRDCKLAQAVASPRNYWLTRGFVLCVPRNARRNWAARFYRRPLLLLEVQLRQRHSGLAVAILLVGISIVPASAQVANPELEACRSTGLIALREHNPSIKDVSLDIDGMTVAKANTKVEDTPIKTIVIGDAYLEKGKKDTRRTFLCLIGEKGKVLLTFFTDK